MLIAVGLIGAHCFTLWELSKLRKWAQLRGAVLVAQSRRSMVRGPFTMISGRVYRLSIERDGETISGWVRFSGWISIDIRRYTCIWDHERSPRGFSVILPTGSDPS